MYQQYQPSSAFGQPVQSQYRGKQSQFQPTGNVQSFYNPQPSQSTAAGRFQQSQAVPSAFAASRPAASATWTSQRSAPVAGANVPVSQYSAGPQAQVNPSSYHLPNYGLNQQSRAQSSGSWAAQPAFGSTNVPTSQYSSQFQQFRNF